jgi:hypothetical protein
MLEMVVKAFLGAQALEKLQIRFPILRAEITGRVIAKQFEASVLAGNAVLLKHLAEDLGHRQRAENSLAETLGQARQLRPQTHVAKPDARTMVTLDQFMQLAVESAAFWPEMQNGRTVQQAGKVERRVIDQQIHIEHKGLADRFSTGKGQDFERVGQTGYVQTK